MASFGEPYDTLVAWDFGTGPTSHFTLASTSPAPYLGLSRSTLDFDNTAWAAAVFDADDGNVPTTTYWVSYAFYIPDWDLIFTSDNNYVNLPGFINFNDDPMKGITLTDDVTLFMPSIQADSSSAGKVYTWTQDNGGDAVTEGAWHTLRYALKMNGASSAEELWLDGVQVYTGTPVFSGAPAFSSGLAGVAIAGFGDTGTTDVFIAHDSLLYAAGADPGEPTEESHIDIAVSDPTDVVDAAPPPSGDPPGEGNDCEIAVVIDGIDMSPVAIEGSVTRRLNRPALASVKIPMDSAIGTAGSILKIYFGGTLFFHGMVMDCETDSGEDDGYTVYNASDPMELWNWRVVRADDGDFSKPAGDGGVNDLFATYVEGPAIMNAVLKNTEGNSTAQGNPALTPPSDAEGPTFLTFGGIAGDGCDLSGAPDDWPQTIAQLFSLLVSTGCLDAVITPTEPGGGIMGTVDLYNGDYGTDLSGSVSLQYGMGSYTIRNVRWNVDMSTIVNKLWYYGGPRVGTASDPPGDQHWCWNITGDDPEFDPAGSAGLVPPGGRNSPPASSTDNQLGVRRIDSQVNDGPNGTGYGVRMDVRIYDSLSDNCLGGSSFDPERWLYRRNWQSESWARAVPRELIHVTPIRGYPLGMFDIGDLITVEAASSVRGGFSGAQRIYQYTVSWDADGPCEISELQTSSDVGVDTGV